MINTRFGSFPHSTLVDKYIGSQVRASNVDTGRRSRKSARSSRKRKRGKDGSPAREDHEERAQNEEEMLIDRSTSPSSYGPSDDDRSIREEAIEAPLASSGFAHLLPPTPELWTAALPHRTQVVYTPDYSYILQRLRVRPGSRIIESGAGSGSFTHAAARAVYDGNVHNKSTGDLKDESCSNRDHNQTLGGKVFSFEFHEQRVASVQREIQEHGLNDIVTVTHQDVCEDGFSIKDTSEAMHANAVFLDLPAPWLALPHLTRQNSASSQVLNPKTSIHLCAFSPCIEQVQRTVSTLRSLGWVEISMVEIAAKRIETRRERVGLQEEGLKGANPAPANVEEAVQRLKEVEGRSYEFHHPTQSMRNGLAQASNDQQPNADMKSIHDPPSATRQSRIASAQAQSQHRKLYKEGRLVTRDEQVLKSHTSYLVFAILPREWTVEDELEMRRTLPTMVEKSMEEAVPLSKRAMKKQAKRG